MPGSAGLVLAGARPARGSLSHMSDTAPSDPSAAWQPFTFGGVARFARAPVVRLAVAQLVAALFSTVVLLSWLNQAIFPTLSVAVSRLPPAARIAGGYLEWPAAGPFLLATSRHLSLGVETDEVAGQETFADVEIVLGPRGVRLRCVAGEAVLTYPEQFATNLDRNTLEPQWDAWKPALLATAAAVWMAGLLGAWWVLAWLYAVPLVLTAFFFDRDLRYSAATRLAAAALLPGAFLLSGALWAYSKGHLHLPGLALAFVLHVIAGWAYAIGALRRVPRGAEKTSDSTLEIPQTQRPENPFSSP